MRSCFHDLHEETDDKYKSVVCLMIDMIDHICHYQSFEVLIAVPSSLQNPPNVSNLPCNLWKLL
jgi:hypothetical protein